MRLEELQKFSSLVQEDVFAVLTLEGSVAARNHVGGTAPEQVKLAIIRARQQLAAI
jgi:argininosuccinate lyase